MITVHQVDLEIQEILPAFASGELDLEQLENWLVPRSMEAEELPAQTREALYQIELELAEYNHGHRTLHEVRAASALLAATLRAAPRFTTGTSTGTIVPEIKSFTTAGVG